MSYGRLLGIRKAKMGGDMHRNMKTGTEASFVSGADGGETDSRLLKTGAVCHGLLRFDIRPVTSDGAVDLRFAFSDDGTRLLTWDNGYFR